jgi:hypothetical protein
MTHPRGISTVKNNWLHNLKSEVLHFSAKHFSCGVLRGESGSSPLSRLSAGSPSAGDKSQEGGEHTARNLLEMIKFSPSNSNLDALYWN